MDNPDLWGTGTGESKWSAEDKLRRQFNYLQKERDTQAKWRNDRQLMWDPGSEKRLLVPRQGHGQGGELTQKYRTANEEHSLGSLKASDLASIEGGRGTMLYCSDSNIVHDQPIFKLNQLNFYLICRDLQCIQWNGSRNKLLGIETQKAKITYVPPSSSVN